MPASSTAASLAISNLIAGAGAPAPAASGANAQATKANFSSLLDLGANPSVGDSRPERKEKPPVEDGRDMVAVAVDAPQAPSDNVSVRAGKAREKQDSAVEEGIAAPAGEGQEKIAAGDGVASSLNKTQDSQQAQAPRRADDAGGSVAAPEENAADSLSSLRAQMAALMEILSQALSALGLQAAGQAGVKTPAGNVAGVFAFSSAASQNGQMVSGQVAGDAGNDLATQMQEMMRALQAFFAAGQETGGEDGQDALLGQLQAHIEKLQRMLELSSGQPIFANAQVARAVSADPIREALQHNLNALKALLRRESKFTTHASSDAPGDALARLPDVFTGRDMTALAPRFVEASAGAGAAVKTLPASGNPVNATPSSPAALSAGAVAATASLQSNASGTGAQDDGMAQTFVPTASAVAPATSGAGKTEASAFARLLKQDAPRPVAEQVAFTVKTALRDGSSKIHIQLDPQELGKLDIELHVSAGGKTGVVITADQKNTLELLQKDMRGLEQALADAGLKADSGSLSFNLRGQQQDGREQQGFAGASYLKSLPQEEEVPLEIISKTYVLAASDGLDIVI